MASRRDLPTASGNVVSLARAKLPRTQIGARTALVISEETVKLLEAALAEAKSGAVQHCVLVFQKNGREHLATTGLYREQPGLLCMAGFKMQVMATDDD